MIDAVLRNVTNARSEATNAKIQWIKRLGCGYRNRERFRNAIYFHLGGLDLYPDAVATRTKSCSARREADQRASDDGRQRSREGGAEGRRR